jgi:hypothetical protein
MVNFIKPHLLKDNKTTTLPQEFIFFDTETELRDIDEETKEQQFKLGTALYLRRREDTAEDTVERFKFKEISDFWDWSLAKARPKSRLIFISHNLGFDFKVLKGFKILKERGFKITKLILNYNTNIFRFKRNNQVILFLDNLNYFRTTLKLLGDSVGLEKFPMPETTAPEEMWFNYCQRDTEILYYSWMKWLKFIKDNDLGTFGLTLPSQALNAFRHRFNDYKIYIHHQDDITELEREAYHGGRTECFFLGKLEKGNYYDLDINSAYSYVMSIFEYPTNYKTHLLKPEITDLKKFLENYCVIARVHLRTKENVFPYKKDEKLCFPIGSFETTLTTRELEYALERGYIIDIEEMVVYDKAPIFKSYVNFFYTKRQEYKIQGEKAYAYICKIFLNSLYGKFGQKNEIYEPAGEDFTGEDYIQREWDVEEQRNITYRIINGQVEKSMGFEEAYNSFPAISAHITADTRLLLYRYYLKAGKKNVYYVDTDSLFTNEEGYNNLKSEINPLELGKLKLERMGKDLEIKGLKDYVFDGETKIKGIGKDAIKIDDHQYSQWEFEGVRGSLHSNHLNSQIMKKVVKVLRRDYYKGVVGSGGWVRPFKINDLCLKEMPKLN